MASGLLFAITISILTIYVTFFLYANRGWEKSILSDHNSTSQIPSTKISVIIPFRNEEIALPPLLNSLIIQDYPITSFEVLLVDDHSEDKSTGVINDFMKSTSLNLKLLSLDNLISGKKAAITAGISSAKNELIITTDADTIRSASWLSTIALFYEVHKPGMIIGPVCLQGNINWLQRFQQTEFLSLQFITAVFCGYSHPILCNGANLAFEKSLFDEVNGFEGTPVVASGDDIFLMQKIKQRNDKTIRYLHDPNALVYADVELNIGDFIRQRVRWAGKTKYIKDWQLQLVALLGFITAFWTPVLLVLEINIRSLPYLFLSYCSLKFILDFYMLRKVGRDLGQLPLAGDILLSFILHPIYIFTVTFATLFYKPKWKDRKIYNLK